MYSKQAQPTARNNIQYKLRAAAIKVWKHCNAVQIF